MFDISWCSVTTIVTLPLVPAPEVVGGAIEGAGHGAELVEMGVLLGFVAKGSAGGICICGVNVDGSASDCCCELDMEMGLVGCCCPCCCTIMSGFGSSC
jgi:hypothetical protein